MKKKSQTNKRYNLYYSSPYYYLYDGDDNGTLIEKSIDAKYITQKQNELEEKNNDKTNK